MFSSNKFRQGQDKKSHFPLPRSWVSFKFVGFSHLGSLWLQCPFNWHLVIKKEETKLTFLRTVSSMYFSDSFRMLLREMNRVLLCPCPSPYAHPHLYRCNISILMMVFEKTNFLCALNLRTYENWGTRKDFSENTPIIRFSLADL